MFDNLLAWFGDFFTGLKTMVQNLFDWFRPSVIWIVGLVAALATLGDWILQNVIQGMASLAGSLAGLILPDILTGGTLPIAGKVLDALAFANQIVPLTEWFVLLGALMALWLAALAYRLAKSWIFPIQS